MTLHGWEVMFITIMRNFLVKDLQNRHVTFRDSLLAAQMLLHIQQPSADVER